MAPAAESLRGVCSKSDLALPLSGFAHKVRARTDPSKMGRPDDVSIGENADVPGVAVENDAKPANAKVEASEWGRRIPPSDERQIPKASVAMD